MSRCVLSSLNALRVLSALETIASCMVPLAAWCIGDLGSAGSQRKHWTNRCGYATPLSHTGLQLLTLKPAVCNTPPYMAARWAGRL
eukprot:CAMPEP_0119058838 /NCGR_PEP_ID=MMETSP1178-20130426/3103_1 /TAXON_ID=33656 /ORGANISM="unid sp, Strain CCMP2000" /LENGTH=85 /DNA_ID=CAMNT_0007039825 /DNA_START=191 /DNA_END=448 /DNA_ORIENTATION=-